MKTSNEVLFVYLIVILSLSSFIGCAPFAKYTQSKLAETSTEYNLIVEKVQNENLLLNIVRASKNHPIYFTGFNGLRGNMSNDFGAGMSIPFGKIGTGLNGAYSITPSVKYSNNPSVDIVVWDNKEFITGIMSPINMNTFIYYSKLGWPDELLWYLFVRKITITDKEGNKTKYSNSPEYKDENGFHIDDFTKIVKEFKNCKIEEVPDNPELIGPKIMADNLEQLIKTKEAKLNLVFDNDTKKYQLISKKTKHILNCEKDIEDGADYRNMNKVWTKQYDISDDSKKEIRIDFRSIEGILYYLGQIIRAEMEFDRCEPTFNLKNCNQNNQVPLFVAIKSPTEYSGCKIKLSNKEPFVSVKYEGDNYVIPRLAQNDNCITDRDGSMYVLSLVSLLINQQKYGINTAPITGVVNVVGGK